MFGSGGGDFVGVYAARSDGSADWTPVSEGQDLSGIFILVDGGVGERSYLYPKPVGVGPTQ